MDDVRAVGTRNRRQVLGDEHVDRAAANPSPLTADFQEFITRYVWGEIWDRPGLSRQMRSCITVAMVLALNRPDELALHLKAAVRNGVTVEELREILLHSAIYCGVPAAHNAFKIAREVLEGGA